jgi:hypothetical protein
VAVAIWTLDGQEIARAPLYAMHEIPQKTQKMRSPLDWLRMLLNQLKELL